MEDRSRQLEELRLVIPWVSPAKLVFIVFCLLWDLAALRLLQKDLPKGMLLLAPGILLSLLTLSWALNHVVIQVNPGELSIHYAPIPWMGVRKLPTQDIVQLKIQPSPAMGLGNRPAVSSYILVAVMKDGLEVKLLGSLDYHRARSLQERIRRWMDEYRQK